MTQSFQDHFSGVAQNYARFRPHYPPALFDYFASLSPKEAVVWDCAAGTGEASLDLATRFNKVIATDASQEQIAEANPHDRIEYRVAPAEQSGLPDHSVDLITVAQALHWFDLDRFYTEVKRVLRKGGILAAWSYSNAQVEDEPVNQLVQEFYTQTVGPYWPPERKHVVAGYRYIQFPFAEIVPPSFRMDAWWTLEQLLGYFSTWSATNRYIQATGNNPLIPLGEAMARVWGDVEVPRLIWWPLTLKVGRMVGPSGLAINAKTNAPGDDI